MSTFFPKAVLKKLRAQKKANGFTLIELMVVISVVGVLSAVGMPELLKAQDSAKDNSALQEAVAAAKSCSIDVLTGGTSYSTAVNAAAWKYVTSKADACDVTGDTASTIVASGPKNTHTITVTDGVPGKPVTEAI